MRWLERFFPRLIASFNSPFNGQIQVFRADTHYSLQVAGLHQSGQLAAQMWRSVFRRLHLSKPVLSILILGVGGGSVIQEINPFWPQAKIIGIDIDPLMIKLGQKYLSLKPTQRLQLIVADAFSWIKTCHQQFDLIIVDLFCGRTIPPSARTKEFFYTLKHLLVPGGIVAFNQLTLYQEKSLLPQTQKNIATVFPTCEIINLPINRIFISPNHS